MKKWICILSTFVLFVVSGCAKLSESKITSATDAEFVLRLGHLQGETHPYHQGALKFKKLVEEESDGSIRVDIFPSSQLGNGRDQVEGIQLGSIHFHIGSVAPITNFAPKFNVLNMPYLFESREHAIKVLDGEIGEEISKDLDKAGIINLAFMENGWRHMTNNVRPIKTASDAKGLKIRVQESPPYLAFVKALDSNAVPIPFGELYTALEQGVVDGQENPLAQISLNKFDEVQPYLTLTAHNYDAAVFLMSKTIFEKMPGDLQTVVLEASREATDFEREFSKKEEATYLNDLKEAGMQVEENPDIKSFKKAVEPVYKQFEASIGKDLIERIKDKSEGAD
ncbi:TRAP transporter substrate-binding protein [Metabacillus arenae]|uniref:DctP family TRAP transporter solute-binding subunit n=1 Tax=Metabacillus arenae TaxID=2771434 RepID=A0A926NGD7_9BACI|nr:DctP family TRAP transporter solute-binding subunit [Metabacillus arenae]MBD1380605.1 DctP family TRAP transporter solute-binding subunit [Metabacillus arenae]